MQYFTPPASETNALPLDQLAGSNHWDFCDASRWKSLRFFRANLRILQPEPKIAVTSKWLKVET